MKGRCRCLSSGTPLFKSSWHRAARWTSSPSASATMRGMFSSSHWRSIGLSRSSTMTSNARLCAMSLARVALGDGAAAAGAALPLSMGWGAACGGRAAAASAAAARSDTSRAMPASALACAAGARTLRPRDLRAGRWLRRRFDGRCRGLGRLGARAEERWHGGAQHFGPRQFRLGRRRRGSGRRGLGRGAGRRRRPGLRGRLIAAGQKPERILFTGGCSSRRGRTCCVGGGCRLGTGCRIGRQYHRADRKGRHWRCPTPTSAVVPARRCASPCLRGGFAFLSCSAGAAERLAQRVCRLLRQALADRRQNVLQAAARRIGLTHTKPHLSLHTNPRGRQPRGEEGIIALRARLQ